MVLFDREQYKLLNSWQMSQKSDFSPMFTWMTNQLASHTGRQAQMIALLGDLGAGKTTLTRKLLEFWQYRQVVPSPTYTLIEEHATKLFAVVHMDLYRVENKTDLYALGFEDYLVQSDNLIIIEWPKFNLIAEYQMPWICQIKMHADDSRTYDWFARKV